MKRFLDFSPRFDMRLTYPNLSAAPAVGDYDRIFVETEKFPFGRPVEGENCAFLFRQKSDGSDGMSCQGQIVEGEDALCKRVALAGFGIWGPATCEKFTFRFSDGSEKTVLASLANLTSPELKPLCGGNRGEAVDVIRRQDSRILLQLPASRCEIYIYYNVFELSGEKRLREIVCPDNDLLILSALTAEC